MIYIFRNKTKQKRLRHMLLVLVTFSWTFPPPSPSHLNTAKNEAHFDYWFSHSHYWSFHPIVLFLGSPISCIFLFNIFHFLFGGLQLHCLPVLTTSPFFCSIPTIIILQVLCIPGSYQRDTWHNKKK